MRTQTHYIPTNLLSTDNNKTVKGEKFGWKTYILYLSPFKQNSQGKNICPMATVGCAAACLYGSGKGSMSNVQKGCTNKTEFFLNDRKSFLTFLYSEIAQIEVKHKIEGMNFAIRLNGTSDISWEKFILPQTGKNIFDTFPNIQFYDYTKNYLRFKGKLPNNYKLLFSRSETNEHIAIDLLKAGVNAAFVFYAIPETYKGFKVINGDISDLRWRDEEGVIVGLKYKKLTGRGANNQLAFDSGFAIKTALPATLKKAA